MTEMGLSLSAAGISIKPLVYTQGRDESGTYSPGYDVPFTTQSGHFGHVFVPEAWLVGAGWKERAQELIAVRAAQLDAIGNL